MPLEAPVTTAMRAAAFRCGDGACGRAADAIRANRAHQLPEFGVIGVAAAVVADRGANLRGDLGQIADQIVNGLGGQLGVAGEGGVEVVDVGLMVLVVVDVHRLGVNERLKGGVVVGKRGEFVSHRGNLLGLDCSARARLS